MMIRTLVSIATILITAYIGLAVLLAFSQKRMVFYPELPSRDIVATPNHIGLDYEPVEIITADGLRLDGWFVPAAQPRGVVLFFHGNAGNISHRLDSLALFHKLGLSTLIFDYRGYGQSAGTISEKGSYLDAEAAWRWLTESRQIAANEIILFGRSLGAAIATYLATQHRPQGLIIESGFTSVPDMAAALYPFMPVRWLSRLHYDTRHYLQAVTAPVLVIHSRDDEIIPFSHGKMLYAAAHEPKQFLEIHGGHNDGFLRSGSKYLHGLEQFLDSLR